METQILKRVTEHYLSSGDFNGIPVATLISQCESTVEQIETALRALIESNQVVVIGPNVGPNPHILPFNGYDHSRQFESLGGDQNHTCVYPALESQQEELSDELFNDAPYSRELAIGHGQLMYRVFNLDVLERYRNDPRYYYDNDDISGRICIGDEFDQSDSMDDPDKVLLQTFGFAVTPDIQNRAVCVFLRYLHDLTQSISDSGNPDSWMANSRFTPIITPNPLGVHGEPEFRFVVESSWKFSSSTKWLMRWDVCRSSEKILVTQFRASSIS